MSETILEICVDTPDAFDAAIAGGADRIELCSALALGGLTPTPGLIAYARSSPIPVHALIRPRGGNFDFSRAERVVMRAEIDAVRAAGLAGMVIGASLPDGRLDEQTLAELLQHGKGLHTTLHRAFDLVPDMAAAVDIAAGLGFERILTSGGSEKAIDNLERLAAFVAKAAGRLSIMPGSGISNSNTAQILAATGATELHASARTLLHQPEPELLAMGFALGPVYETRAETVAALKASMHLA